MDNRHRLFVRAIQPLTRWEKERAIFAKFRSMGKIVSIFSSPAMNRRECMLVCCCVECWYRECVCVRLGFSLGKKVNRPFITDVWPLPPSQARHFKATNHTPKVSKVIPLKSIPHRRTIHNAVIHQQSLIRSNHYSTFRAALISL